MHFSLHRSHGNVASKKDQLVEDLRSVVADADDLLRAVGNSTAEEFVEAHSRMETRLQEITSGLDNARISASRQACNAFDVTQAYVSENPWKSFGIPAVAGALVFLLLSRHK